MTYSKLAVRSWLVMAQVLATLVAFRGTGPWRITGVGPNDMATNSLKQYREFLKCGPNSLFMFLILSGHSEVTLQQLQNLPVSSEGVSLLVLSDAARQFNVHAEIRRYSPEEIDSIPLPAIGQFKTSQASITPFHFDVIYKVDADRVYLLNGTTGAQFHIRRSKLAQFWTGYVMAEKRSLVSMVMNKWWPALLVACLLTLDLVILAFWFRRPTPRPRSKLMTEAVG